MRYSPPSPSPSPSPSAITERGRSSIHAASATLFGETASPLLAALGHAAEHVVIRSGDVLFRHGDTGDALYIITHGSLEVLDEDGPVARRLAVIGRGGSVGEMALLVGERRSATVRAIRDSELVRIDKAAFDALLVDQPAVAVELARSLVLRLRQASAGRPVVRCPRTIALVPVEESDRGGAAALARALVDALARELGRTGAAVVVTPGVADLALHPGASQLAPGDEGEPRLAEWLSALEDAHRLVLFLTEQHDSPWTARCLRQADLILPIAHAKHANASGGSQRSAQGGDDPSMLVARALSAAPGALGRRELVLLHDAAVDRPAGTARWLGANGVAAHHHVRPDRTNDVRRLARAIAARSVGVVLSGGGARGFSHIGMLRAMDEAGIPVDAVGGTSMGAIIAAQWADGYDVAAMIDACRRHYANGSGFGDHTLPIAALSSGRRTVRILRAMFGDRRIEDLWTRYFAVTTSLTRARATAQDAGPIWLWTRVSCAIPGLAPPVAYDGELLADGGILDNLPVAAMRERCAGYVIAADVSVPIDLRPAKNAGSRSVISGWPLLWERINPFASATPSMPSIVEILERTALVGSVRDSDAAGRLADLYLRPPVDRYGMTSFSAIDALVELGYRHAQRRIEDWQILLRAGTHDGDVARPS